MIDNINVLEKIGQQASLQQFDSVEKMLASMDLKDRIPTSFNPQNSEYVCMLIPEDPDDDSDSEEK